MTLAAIFTALLSMVSFMALPPPTMMVLGCSRIICFRRSISSGLRSFTVMASGGSLSRNFTKPATTGTL